MLLVLIHLIVRKLVLPSPPLLCASPKSRTFMLPRQRAFPLGGRECGRNSRRTGGCGFGGMGAGVMPHRDDGQGTGCQAAFLTLQPGTPLFQWCQPQHSERPTPMGGGKCII